MMFVSDGDGAAGLGFCNSAQLIAQVRSWNTFAVTGRSTAQRGVRRILP